MQISHKPLDLAALSAERLGSVPRFPKLAPKAPDEFRKPRAQEGKIPALPFDLPSRLPFKRALAEGSSGTAGNVMDCAWII